MLSVIIVTHNSEPFIDRCFDSLDRQTSAPDRIVIVDSGSAHTSYLDRYSGRADCEVVLRENIGFAAANNVGFTHIGGAEDYVCVMNPDTFLEPDSFQSALAILSARERVGILGGRLKGFDVGADRPTGLLDSTGIFRSWYGRWYDRGQGAQNAENFRLEEDVPALCGAFMVCRMSALRDELPNVFDESFFMYKEDIDLSLRLRKKGWELLYAPTVEAFHARGWAGNRKEISHQIRCLASKNDILLNLKHRSPYLIWAVAKYLAVRVLRI